MKTQKNIRLLFTLALVFLGIEMFLELVFQLFQKPILLFTNGITLEQRILLPTFLYFLIRSAAMTALVLMQRNRVSQKHVSSTPFILTIAYLVFNYICSYAVQSFELSRALEISQDFLWHTSMGLNIIDMVQFFYYPSFVCLIAGTAMFLGYSYGRAEASSPSESIPPQEMQ